MSSRQTPESVLSKSPFCLVGWARARRRRWGRREEATHPLPASASNLCIMSRRTKQCHMTLTHPSPKQHMVQMTRSVSPSSLLLLFLGLHSAPSSQNQHQMVQIIHLSLQHCCLLSFFFLAPHLCIYDCCYASSSSWLPLPLCVVFFSRLASLVRVGRGARAERRVLMPFGPALVGPELRQEVPAVPHALFAHSEHKGRLFFSVYLLHNLHPTHPSHPPQLTAVQWHSAL